jgi:ornithine cyclodeaminase
LARLSTLPLSDALKIKDITAIGDVINGVHPGRRSDHEITLFDGTGVGLQDLEVASAAVKLASEQGRFTFVGL